MTQEWWVQDGSDRLERLRRALRSACSAAWRASRRLENEPADADAWVSSGAGHLGDPGEAIDAHMQLALESSLRHRLPEAHVLGEEIERTLVVRREGLLILVDACDGTLLRDTLGIGWGTSLIALIWLPDRGWQPIAAAVSSSTGHVVTYTRPRLVQVGRMSWPADDDRIIADVRRPEEAARVVIAMVGAKASMLPRFAALAEALSRSGAFAVFNIGGSPLAYALTQLELDAVVTLNPSAPWDCAHTLIAAAGGAYVATLGSDGLATRVPLAGVEAWFRLDADPQARKTVPPHVVARSERALTLIVEAYGSAVENQATSSAPPTLDVEAESSQEELNSALGMRLRQVLGRLGIGPARWRAPRITTH